MKRFRANFAYVAVALLVIIAGLAGTSPAQTVAADSLVHPALTFSSYLLGPLDRVNAVAAANDGSLYVAGVTLAHAGAMDARAISAGEGDAFVARLSPDGSRLIYFTYLGSSGLDEARAIAVDSVGNAYVVGKTRSTNFAVVRPLQSSCSLDGAGACQGTAFVAKIGPGGQVVFATYFGGRGGDEANAIAVDGSGNMFFAGSTHSLDFPVTEAVQRIAGGNGDAFVAGISADASHVLFATYVGGSDFDEARALALDAVGNLYVAGQTRSLDFPVSNGLQSQCATRAGSCQGTAFVTTLSANGQQVRYSTYLGGSGGDAANAIVVDGHGQAYVAGVTRSTDFPVSQGGQRQLLGKSNAFISKLSAQGSALVFSTYFGGSGADQANAIALDRSGNVVVAGWTYSGDFPRQAPLQAACAVNKNGACTFDAFLASLSPDGSQLRFSTFLGGTGTDILRSLSVDNQGSAYLGGWTTSRDFPQGKAPQLPGGVTASSSSRKSGAFLAKVSGLNLPAPSVSCGGGTNNWTGSAGDNQWGTAANWSTGSVPISTDNVCIASTFSTTINVGGLAAANQTIASVNSGDTLSFNGGPLTITGNATFGADLAVVGGSLVFSGTTSMTTMHLSGGVVSGNGTITLSGLLTWGNGAICTAYNGGCPAGTNAVVNINGGMNLTSGFPSLQARTLNNPSGQTVTYTEGSSLNLGAAAVVNNIGTWDLTNDGNVLQSGNNDTFNNTGTLKKTSGTGNSYIDAIFNNTGVVTVSATLLMRGGSGCSAPCTGSWTVNTGGSLQFPSGVWTLGTGMTNNSTAVAGILFDGGTMDFANTGTDTFTGPITLAAGVVYGPATLNFAGLLTWGNGAICTAYNGGCPAGTNAVVNINGGMNLTSGFPSLQARTLNNPSGQTVTYTEGSSLNLGAAAVVNNIGTWDLTNDGNVFQSGNNDTFNNTGTLKKTSGTGNSYIDAIFNNTGVVTVSATLLMRGGSGCSAPCTGSWTVNTGGSLQFPSGVWTLGTGMTNNSTAVAGILFDGGTMDFANTGTDTFTGPITLAAGVVYGPATLNFAGLLTWGNGAICTAYNGGCPAGTNAVVNINGGMNLTSGFPSLQARTLNNPSGQTVTYTEGSSLNLGAAAVVNNIGTWDLTNDGNVLQSGNNDTFNNTGTLKKTSGTGNSYIDAIFNNTGVVTVSATLLMRGGSGCSAPCTGSWTVNTGGSLQFPSGVWTLGTGMTNNSTAVAGILFDGGTMDFANTGTDTFTGPITLAAGVVYGPATLNFAGLLTWGNGAICTAYNGGCPAGTNAVVNINGGMNLTSGFPSLQARTLNNPSGQTVTYTEGSSLNLGAAAVVNNIGTWDLTNDGNVFQSGNNDTFNNTGTLKKTSGTGNSYIDAIFNNTGVVTVSATLLMRGGSGCSAPCTGSWTVNTGGSLQFPSGVWTLGTGMTNNSTAVAGILFDGGTMDFANTGTDTFTGPITLAAGVVYGPATLNFAGLLTWGNGAICTAYNGGCPAGTNAVVNINGGMNLTSGFPSLQARTLNNPSGQTVTYTEGSSLNLGAAAVVNNIGTWDLTNDGNVFQSGNNDIFNNKGTLKKTSGTGNSYVDSTFNNSGSVLDNGGSSTAMLFRGTYSQTAGTTKLGNGAALQFTNGTATFSGGTFTGNGNVLGNLSNTGANFQGGTDSTTGTVAVSGTYNQGAAGIFTAKISGASCTPNDEFTFTGAATLGGPLAIATVNGCAPASGAQFTVMTFSSKTGTFSSVTKGWSVTYNTTSVVVTYSAGSPAVTLTPASVNFGTQLINVKSAVKKVTVKNSGTDGFYIASISISGDYAESDSCAGYVINPGATCTISVTFTPTAMNTRTGTITITDDAGTGSQTVPLTGMGTYLKVTPSTVAFPAQLLNTASSPITVTLQNTNPTSTLSITGMTISGTASGDYSENKACDTATLAANGGTCSFTVTFTPSAVGKRSAALKITENGRREPDLGDALWLGNVCHAVAFAARLRVGDGGHVAGAAGDPDQYESLGAGGSDFGHHVGDRRQGLHDAGWGPVARPCRPTAAPARSR